MDSFLELDLHKMSQVMADSHGFLSCMKIDLEDYQRLWMPWRKALIIKILARKILHKLLMQQILELWKLDWEWKFIGLEAGYYLVRFC